MSMEKVAKVNEILLKGEPTNISVDEHSGYTGYKPQAVVDAMNEVFWGEWGFEEVSSEITPGEKGLAIAQVRVWLKDVDFKPTSYGQNRVTRGDIGDARKGAQTDAIKKALSYFSIGNRAYHGLLPDKKEQAQARQQVSNQRPPATPAARPAQETAAPAQESKPIASIPTMTQILATAKKYQVDKKLDEILADARKRHRVSRGEEFNPDQCADIAQRLKSAINEMAKAS